MVALIDLDSEVRGDTVLYDLTLSRVGALAGWMNGGSITFMIKRKASDADADALITKTTASGITWTDQAAILPTATVLINDDDWDLVALGKNLNLLYEVEIVDAGGRRETVQKGTLPILADVVRGA